VKVSWGAPQGNSDTIVGYNVFIADSLGSFLAETTYCNGLADPVLSQEYCKIPMTYLRGSPYNLIIDTLVEAKVQAINAYGAGSLSSANVAGA